MNICRIFLKLVRPTTFHQSEFRLAGKYFKRWLKSWTNPKWKRRSDFKGWNCATGITRNEANSPVNNYIGISFESLSLGGCSTTMAVSIYICIHIHTYLLSSSSTSERDHFSRLGEDEKSFNVLVIETLLGRRRRRRERDGHSVFQRPWYLYASCIKAKWIPRRETLTRNEYYRQTKDIAVRNLFSVTNPFPFFFNCDSNWRSSWIDLKITEDSHVCAISSGYFDKWNDTNSKVSIWRDRKYSDMYTLKRARVRNLME